MDKVAELLRISSKLSVNVRLRDRSLKVLQYGCQMMVGYYCSKMSSSYIDKLKSARKIASTSRKAFWMFKSLNHVSTSLDLINSMVIHNSFECSLFVLDLLEQLSLIVYYICENVVFMSRTGLIETKESSVETVLNMSWFIGDLAGFLSIALRLFANLQSHFLSSTKKSLNTCTYTSDLSLSLAVAGMELGVSADYVDVWRRLLGYSLGDGTVGLLGALSSVLIIYQGAIVAIRQSHIKID